jgi:hypothetical protein
VGAVCFCQMFSLSQQFPRWLDYWAVERWISVMYEDSFRTSHRTQYASIRKTNLWML